MKKVVLGLIALLSFTACNKNDFEPMTDQEIKEAKYAAAFEQVFGTISQKIKIKIVTTAVAIQTTNH
jgi:hypothetical protein